MFCVKYGRQKTNIQNAKQQIKGGQNVIKISI